MTFGASICAFELYCHKVRGCVVVNNKDVGSRILG